MKNKKGLMLSIQQPENKKGKILDTLLHITNHCQIYPWKLLVSAGNEFQEITLNDQTVNQKEDIDVIRTFHFRTLSIIVIKICKTTLIFICYPYEYLLLQLNF